MAKPLKLQNIFQSFVLTFIWEYFFVVDLSFAANTTTLITEVNNITFHLTIINVEVFPTRAIVYWTGFSPTDIEECELKYKEENSSHTHLMSYTPATNSFGLSDLHPNVLYHFSATCYDSSSAIYQSTWYNFTTSSDSIEHKESGKTTSNSIENNNNNNPLSSKNLAASTPNPKKQMTPHQGNLRGVKYNIIPPSHERNSAKRQRYKQYHTPHLFGKPLRLTASAVDIGLGVAFALIGMAVIVTAAVYVVKEYRRRMRVRRFLQYRQQENEPFSEMEEEDCDDGVVL